MRQVPPNVFTNSAKTVRVGDKTSCGDPATVGSPKCICERHQST